MGTSPAFWPDASRAKQSPGKGLRNGSMSSARRAEHFFAGSALSGGLPAPTQEREPRLAPQQPGRRRPTASRRRLIQ